MNEDESESSSPDRARSADQIIYRDPSKNPPGESDRAVALNYDEEDEAPRVTAKGEGDLARKIIQLAEQEDIPVYQDEELVELLYGLDLDEQIPPSLYEVVAEVFAFIYRLNQDQKAAGSPESSPPS